MATECLVVLNKAKAVVPNQKEDAMFDVPEDGHVEGVVWRNMATTLNILLTQN